MKKVNIYRFCNYALMALISCTLAISKVSPALTQTVSLINPTSVPAINLIWPTQGVLSQGFRKYQHEGIDIAGAKGTPILAAAAGKVVKAGWDDWGLGNFIEIKHLNGNVTVYGHNSRLLVSKGQQVKQGQIIAEMGSTGNSSAPHLHFEFYVNGRLASNPISLLPSTNIAKTPVNKPISPTLQPVLSVSDYTDCDGTTVMNGETATVSIKVCEENGQLFYLGKLKQEPSQVLKIRAWKVDNNKYQANNGSFSYLISPEKIEIWRNGSPIRADSFLTFNGLGK
ncbi:M23 family metallopeptidase [Dolichospermum sp. UHCC 0259]|uniref:M23 family metallopeptidase n=1 Tax=Dolichospermum sp. UHCC 0259 TaxID=2590010 RepID=UPI00144620DB|nr:M23 family metallopeptidase [Dolichospermum sp. UHCC 0259]MTJ49305.1 M23 family metallopeptidase [Dolichospermum sp. UHCC 0259]